MRRRPIKTGRAGIVLAMCTALLLWAFPAGAWAGTAYVANEATATISVIDTKTNKIIRTIGLGSDPAIPLTPQPNGPLNGEKQHHDPLYNGHADPHGLSLTADGNVLLVACRLSSTVVAVDTKKNRVMGYVPVGREPHLATVRPASSEAWTAIRGESHITVLGVNRKRLRGKARRSERLKPIATVDTVKGPSMVTFTSDGRFAFVASAKQKRLDKIDAGKRRIVKSLNVRAHFTPFAQVSPDNREIWLVHKATGSISVVRADNLQFIFRGLSLGPRPNHIFFLGRLAYITIGGPSPTAQSPDPQGKLVVFNRQTRKVVREFTGAAFAGDPHGIWGSSDGKLFIGHERGNKITVIKTGRLNDPNDDSVQGTVTGPEGHTRFLKKPIDIVIKP